MSFTIVPAYRESFRRPGAMVRSGWHLIELEGEYGDEWVAWFSTKREAQAAAQRMEDERREQAL